MFKPYTKLVRVDISLSHLQELSHGLCSCNIPGLLRSDCPLQRACRFVADPTDKSVSIVVTVGKGQTRPSQPERCGAPESREVVVVTRMSMLSGQAYESYSGKKVEEIKVETLVDVITRRPGSRDIKGKEREENANIRPKKKAGGNSNPFVNIFLLETGE
ncbi:hypothetical protein J6590_073821 [Homalodisca vitripennis]|nr:hypothetical protein J6590_073821 [Homalodisca vitripennis]